jgi:hypothetical protein
MSDRRFTPDSARQALVKLRPAAERMCRLYRRLERRRPGRIVPEQRVDPLYFSLVERLHRALGEIRSGGARVRDLRRGLLDFPARRAGRDVLLCWRVGERSLEFWHEQDEGYAGRRRVDDDGPWDDL